MRRSKKDRYAPPINTAAAENTMFLKKLAWGGGVAQDGPSSPNLFSVFWDPCDLIAYSMGPSIQGPGARRQAFRVSGAWVAYISRGLDNQLPYD